MASEEQVQATEPKPKQRKERKYRSVRRFPLLLRVLVVLLLMAVMTVIGAIIGYSVIGGGDWKDVFDLDTWRHITDFWLT